MNTLGLTQSEAAKRLEKFGKNELVVKKPKALIIQFLEEFTDLMVIILLVAVVISAIAGQIKDAAVILFIVLLNATISFVQKFKAEKAIEALQKLVAPTAKVLRDGKIETIDATEIVPGDIILLSEGDKIAADGILIEASELHISEATLTGESVPVIKGEEQTVYMGTSVTRGTGKFEVTATGKETEFGHLAHLTQTTTKDKSPLQKELAGIGIFVGKVTIGISALLILLGIFVQGKTFVETFIFAVSVAVAAVPEGLPATITIALALGVQRLASKRAIVKQLASVETLGSTTVICSDKTGTITKNEMTVKKITFRDHAVHVSGVGYAPEGKIEFEDPHLEPYLEKLSYAAALCNNAELIEKDDQWEMIGDPTEGALLTMLRKAGFHVKNLRENQRRVYEQPFDSDRKLMTTINEDKKTSQHYLNTKGAPDEILKICSHIYINGEVIPITEEHKKYALKNAKDMADESLRVLGFAYRKYDKPVKEHYVAEELEKDLIFIGLVGMIDPPRPGIKEALSMSRKAGIRTIMITGDYGPTALAIAKEIGYTENHEKIQTITGDKLEEMTDTDLKHLLKKKEPIIFARVRPKAKLRIVSALKDLGEVVAVTGDGVNDAPALKRADIGIAMGIIGTDVSKEASNMVLADDSYRTIVRAIKEGRTIYENLKKFVFYIFSSNIGELVTVFTAILLALPAPLTAILILSVDLGTDVLPALAIGVDTPEKDIMERPPRNPKTKIMTRGFIINFLIVGFFIGGVVLATYFTVLNYDTYLKASTSAFVMLVFIQMFHTFSVRSLNHSIFRTGIFTNLWLIGAIFISVLVTLSIVEIPFMQDYFGTTHLTLKEWLTFAGISFSVILFEEIRKLIIKTYKKSHA